MIFYFFLNRNEIQENLKENDRNEEKEEKRQHQRSNSVVEIVNKLNNLSCKESWEKMMKRRPVYDMNEMEKELEKSSPIHSSDDDNNKKDEYCSMKYVDSNDNSHDTIDKCCVIVNNDKDQQDDAVNNNNNNNHNDSTKLSNHTEDNHSFRHIKRMKGSLKKDDVQQRIQHCLQRQCRRVSFDPLALLLDASLEGELELVKKTAIQVSELFELSR